MDERLKKPPASEVLRQNLLVTSSATSRNKEDWTPEGKAHAIANGMPWIFGYFKAVDDPNSSIRPFCEQSLDAYATELGLESHQKLRTALIELRQQLKDELPKESWEAYFEDTLDIT